MLACGIVGLPNVGKSTLFNCLTRAGIASENYPFCTIEPNVGRVAVPDGRLEKVAALAGSAKIEPAVTQFIDIAGLVEGASRGEGLGNQFLSNIRTADAIIQVVRCFEDTDIIHVAGKVDPVADIKIIQTELILSDLERMENALEKFKKLLRSGKKEDKKKYEVLEYVAAGLSAQKSARQLDLTEEMQEYLKPYQLLTQKPVLFLANIAEAECPRSAAHVEAVHTAAAEQSAQVIPFCAVLEQEISTLEDRQEREEFMAALGMQQAGLDRVIQASYSMLGLETFFTVGPKEARAWAIQKRCTAPEAAAAIHSDFQRGFIRAEVISYADYIACGGEQGAKSAGKWRLEGKEYRVEDGDVILFRFNV
eukprot:TRINITY_DN9982_c0_g1_i1.p1 TRINITY_DN9982_c0_g1~~TRINITY_DN9982_c0_g1_i1.p1  ORF type:complete len:365 (+),score=-45.45 TRINITY_DN9982_c0_g1_i1:3444-4538(+)